MDLQALLRDLQRAALFAGASIRGSIVDGTLQLHGAHRPTHGNAVMYFLQQDAAFVVRALLGLLESQHLYAVQLCRSMGLFFMGPSVHVRFVNFRCVPKRTFLANHHRFTTNMFDRVAQFLLACDRTMVYTSLGHCNGHPWARRWSAYLQKMVYNSIDVNHLVSEDRFWSLVEPLLSGACDKLSVFPDYDGSMYFGDSSFSFREGLFAASMFAGLPIIDHVLVEPTAACPETTINLIMYRPPPVIAGASNAREYATWRAAHASSITAYTRACEATFKNALRDLESAKASCGLTDDTAVARVCLLDKARDTGAARNYKQALRIRK